MKAAILAVFLPLFFISVSSAQVPEAESPDYSFYDPSKPSEPYDGSKGCAPITSEWVEFCEPEQLARIQEEIPVCSQEPEVELMSCLIYPGDVLLNQTVSHAEAEKLLYHAQLNVFQLYDVFGQVQPIVCAAPKVNDFTDAVFGCDRTVQCVDIREGNTNLWKPVAESNPSNSVVLVDRDLEGEPVKLTDAEGNEVANQSRQVCCPNGGREHRFFDKRGDQLRGPVFIRFESACYRVDDPSIRNE